MSTLRLERERVTRQRRKHTYVCLIFIQNDLMASRLNQRLSTYSNNQSFNYFNFLTDLLNATVITATPTPASKDFKEN